MIALENSRILSSSEDGTFENKLLAGIVFYGCNYLPRCNRFCAGIRGLVAWIGSSIMAQSIIAECDYQRWKRKSLL